MPRLGVILLAVAAIAAGIYLSSWHDRAATPAAISRQGDSLVGKQRPDFHLASTTGRFVRPADFPGKVLLVNFWATWCVPCRKEMPELMALQKQYGDSGLQVIGIALDEMQNVNDFIQNLGISYPILVGEGDVMQTNYDYGNVSGLLPYSVLVDRDGIIRWQSPGEIQRNEVSELLKASL